MHYVEWFIELSLFYKLENHSKKKPAYIKITEL